MSCVWPTAHWRLIAALPALLDVMRPGPPAPGLGQLRGACLMGVVAFPFALLRDDATVGLWWALEFPPLFSVLPYPCDEGVLASS